MKNLPGLLLIIILTTMMQTNAFSGNIRPTAVAGQFYPANAEQLTHDVNSYYNHATDRHLKGTVRAIIVPHAGYVFSGAVAAEAYRQIPPAQHYDHIFLLGPSHHTWVDGASVPMLWQSYATPLGAVPVDTALCKQLISSNSYFTSKVEAHEKEHCLEVQLPFLQLRLQHMPPIVPIVIGTERFAVLQKIAGALKPYFNDRNLFVISSDFSHYPKYDDAERVDSTTGQAIESGSVNQFVHALQTNAEAGVANLATSACGQCAIAVLLLMSQGDTTLTMHHLCYRNSGDSPYGGKEQVVGYHAFVQTAEAQSAGTTRDAATGFSLTDDDKQLLHRIAWTSIKGGDVKALVAHAGKALSSKCGAFVTLTEGGRLRGCIGHFGSDVPLWQTVAAMARDAAFHDPRFKPVTRDEWDSLQLEISVITPLKRIHNISEFQYGKQGIFIKKGWHTGTFLPQVAHEVNWTKEEFLSHCAQDKAGIGWDGWRTAELYTYEAIVF